MGLSRAWPQRYPIQQPHPHKRKVEKKTKIQESLGGCPSLGVYQLRCPQSINPLFFPARAQLLFAKLYEKSHAEPQSCLPIRQYSGIVALPQRSHREIQNGTPTRKFPDKNTFPEPILEVPYIFQEGNPHHICQSRQVGNSWIEE